MPAPSKEKAQLHEQGLRKCSRCERVLPESDYNKNSRDRFGLARWCRRCSAQRSEQWYSDNRELQVCRASEWSREHPERRKEIANAWARRNPESGRQSTQRRRTRKVSNGVFKVADRDLLRLTSASCYHCGASSEHIDHIIPISRGGSHSIGNLGPMCAQCNQSKGAKTYAEFRYGR